MDTMARGEQRLLPLNLFGDFPYLALEFELEAEEDFPLPVFSGSSFRGLFGHALREVACQKRTNDDRCAEPSACPYAYLFETSGADMPGQTGDDAARPFVLEPPLGFRRISGGTRFTLGLRLFGHAVTHAPLFAEVLHEMGRRGLGQARATFRIGRVFHRDVSGQRHVYKNPRRIEIVPSLLSSVADQSLHLQGLRSIELHFLTPARLVHRGEVTDEPEFHVVIRALLRRLDALMRRHWASALPVDFRALIEEAGQCGISSSALRWFDWARWSERQQKRMTMGGIMGPIRYIGPVGPFMPLLAAGTVIHIGKSTTFGMGRYDLRAVIRPL
jgi:hypothetical protein